ncbi:hypothetical protein ACFFX0_12045 [Citricoccus parietis]|uniref:Uncharacterized protein n=1 Tax=Citricoccus parietis TaxID=592307 RepID=A0ABV5G076_9MICC
MPVPRSEPLPGGLGIRHGLLNVLRLGLQVRGRIAERVPRGLDRRVGLQCGKGHGLRITPRPRVR